MDERTIRIGMLGCGTVGAATIRMLHEHADDIALRAGCRVEVTKVAVRDLDRERAVPLPVGVFTTDVDALVADPGVDVVCELIGGLEPARSLLLRALEAGKPV